MQALRILMEFGSATEKIKAREELCSIAYGGARTEMDEDNVMILLLMKNRFCSMCMCVVQYLLLLNNS